MTIIRPVRGLMANWTFEPPVSTPISRRMASEASRIRWYSLSVSVCAGATVMLSPVWTPIGSKFSIEQTITALSAQSRITSISYSFQPMSALLDQDRVDRAELEPVGDHPVELFAVVGDAAAGAAQREAGPQDAGQADLVADLRGPRRGCGPGRSGRSPGRSPPCTVLNSSRSSALRIASALAPISWQPCRSSAPLSCRARPTFRPVWPPSVGSTASGFSTAMICSTTSG